MLTNQQFADQFASLQAQYKAGTITQTQLANSTKALLDDWMIQITAGGLATKVSDLVAKFNEKWSAFQLTTLKGVKTLVADLPATGNSNGDWWWVNEASVGNPNGQAYIWITSQWVPQGATLLRGTTGLGVKVGGAAGQVLAKLSAADGDTQWLTVSGTGTVTSVNASGGTTGMNFTGGPVTAAGTLTLAGVLNIANGGTGQTTANGSLNALLPAQAGKNTYVLTSDGTNASWQASAGGSPNWGSIGGSIASQTDLQTALGLKANNASPALTGTPTAPTATAGTNTTQIATTAFVSTAIGNLISSSPAALDTLNELATALGNDPNFATTMTNALAAKAPLASPAFTGTPTAPTATSDTSNTQLATTAFAKGLVNGSTSKTTTGGNTNLTAAEASAPVLVIGGTLTSNATITVPTSNAYWLVKNNTTGAFTLTVKTAAGTGVTVTQGTSSEVWCDGTNVVLAQTDFNSPALTGSPTAPTQTSTDNSTKLATTAFVKAQGYATAASPALTGTPTAPTPSARDNSTKIATTAYVDAAAKESLMVAVSDEATALTTGTSKITFRMPYAFTLSSVRASLSTASTSGLPTIDIKRNGTTIFSTTLTIDANEKTSVTAATAAVLSTTSLSDDDEITIDITTAGTGAKGLKVTFIGNKT